MCMHGLPSSFSGIYSPLIPNFRANGFAIGVVSQHCMDLRPHGRDARIHRKWHFSADEAARNGGLGLVVATLVAMSLSPTALLAATKSSGGGSAVFQLFFFGLIFVAMYFLLIRPQRRRAKEAQELVRAVQIGDEVQMSSGFIGFITGFDEDDSAGSVVWVELVEGVEVRALKSAIVRRIEVRTEAAAVESDDSDESDK